MKNINRIYYLFIILLFVLQACEPKPLDMKIKTNKSKIVISPVFNSQSELGVLVTKSFSANISMQKDPLDILNTCKIENVSVSLENNGVSSNLQGINPVFVTNTISFRPYSQYTITVRNNSNGETVKATTTMLPQVSIDAISLNVSRKFMDTSLHLKIRLNENADVKRYYMAVFKLNQTRGAVSGKKSILKQSLYNQVELFDNSNASNGKLVYEKTHHRSMTSFGADDSLVVEVSEVSEDYYRYLEIYRKTNSFINRLTGEPINLTSNVQGGMGFFFLLYPACREFELINH